LLKEVMNSTVRLLGHAGRRSEAIHSFCWPEDKMEVFFAYARMLKRELEKLRRKTQDACPNPPSDKPDKTTTPFDPQESLRFSTDSNASDL
jgi:hypothetical protein